MLTLAAIIIVMLGLFTFPAATILGALGVWLLGPLGGIVGVITGLVLVDLRGYY